MKHVIISASLCLFILMLSACQSDTGTPPSLAITSPAAGSPVSGTTAVQVSTGDAIKASRIDLYVRGKGETGRGKQVGSAVQGPPFVISWNTTDVPNAADVELIAVGQAEGGGEGESQPVAVKTQNSGTPSFQLLSAFTIPPDPTVGASELGASLPNIRAAAVLPPTDITLADLASAERAALSPQAEGERDYILEWQWEPFAAGADGYSIFRSDDDITGTYELERRQAATAGTGAQKFSKKVEGAGAGDSYYGAVRAISGSGETGYSNADKATFLPPHEAVSPEEGATVTGGRPTLTWSKTPGTVGYLYYVYDKNPWEAGATLLWSNFPQSDSSLSGVYPTERAALTSGTYHWWVAGVSFDQNGKADGFTFSEPRSFVVP